MRPRDEYTRIRNRAIGTSARTGGTPAENPTVQIPRFRFPGQPGWPGIEQTGCPLRADSGLCREPLVSQHRASYGKGRRTGMRFREEDIYNQRRPVLADSPDFSAAQTFSFRCVPHSSEKETRKTFLKRIRTMGTFTPVPPVCAGRWTVPFCVRGRAGPGYLSGQRFRSSRSPITLPLFSLSPAETDKNGRRFLVRFQAAFRDPSGPCAHPGSLPLPGPRVPGYLPACTTEHPHGSSTGLWCPGTREENGPAVAASWTMYRRTAQNPRMGKHIREILCTMRTAEPPEPYGPSCGRR